MEVLAGIVVLGLKVPVLVIQLCFAIFSWVVGKILDKIFN